MHILTEWCVFKKKMSFIGTCSYLFLHLEAALLKSFLTRSFCIIAVCRFTLCIYVRRALVWIIFLQTFMPIGWKPAVIYIGIYWWYAGGIGVVYGIRVVSGWYTGGIRAVYGWYTGGIRVV